MRILGVIMILAVSLAACRTNPSNVAEIVTDPTPSTPAITAVEFTVSPPAPLALSPSPTWRPFLQTPTAIATTMAPTPVTPTVLPEATTQESIPPTLTPAAAEGGCVPAPPPGWAIYLVQPGDTVGHLAQCSGASIAAIAAANCLTGALPIFAGQALYLPPGCLLTTATPTLQESAGGVDQTNSGTTIPFGVPPQPGPAGVVSLMPDLPVPPGGLVTISFTNFLADTWLTVSLNPIDADAPPGGKDEYIVRTNTQGNYQMDLLIPQDYPPGEIDITATTGNITGSVTLIIGEPSATTELPTDTPFPIPNPATMVP